MATAPGAGLPIRRVGLIHELMAKNSKLRCWIIGSFTLLGGVLGFFGSFNDAVYSIYVVPKGENVGVFTVELFGITLEEKEVPYDGPKAARERRSQTKKDRANERFDFLAEAKPWGVGFMMGSVLLFSLIGWGLAGALIRRG